MIAGQREVVQRIRVRFQDKVFNTIIRESTRLAECPISGLPITLYAPGSIGAEDYTNLAREVINGEKPLLVDNEVLPR
ncbi:MAG: ParA family protein [Planctomycetes bacterium]|nr:ParA family protein [Planctomycetota bacterium]